MWLKAPPRRAAGQNQCRWLREEGDATRAAKFARKTNYHNSGGDNNSSATDQIIKESNSRSLFYPESSAFNADRQLAGFKTNSNLLYGLHEEENIGIKFDERKRRREDPVSNSIMDVDMGLPSTGLQVTEHTEADVSKNDSTTSISTISAEPAVQASRLQ